MTFIRLSPLFCNKNPIYVFPEKELRGLSSNFHIHVSVSNLNIPGSVHIFSWSRIGRTILGIHKFAHRHMNVEVGTEAGRSSLSGNICFKFSVLCPWSTGGWLSLIVPIFFVIFIQLSPLQVTGLAYLEKRVFLAKKNLISRWKDAIMRLPIVGPQSHMVHRAARLHPLLSQGNKWLSNIYTFKKARITV